MKPNLRKDIADLVDSALEEVVFASPLHNSPDFGGTNAAAGNLKSCDFHLIDEVANELGHEQLYLNPDYQRTDVRDLAAALWPIDFAAIIKKPDHWFVTRVATVLPKEIRGIARIVPQKCVAVSHARIRGHAADSELRILGLVGGQWRPLDGQSIEMHGGKRYVVRDDPEEMKRLLSLVGMIFSVRLSARYSWHAALGFNDGPRIVVPTSAEGCRHLFKLRDLAETETRRRALKHWVSHHYRERSSDESALDYVRDHLRGNTRFSWNKLDCELLVSEWDLERNERFQTQAAEWRAVRKHNRVRVRLKGPRAA